METTSLISATRYHFRSMIIFFDAQCRAVTDTWKT